MRRTCLAIGLSTLGLAWLAPLGELLPGPFSTHMVMHMGVVAIAAPCLAVGIGGRRCDPVSTAPLLFAPIPASLVELVIVWAWHTPALHHAARHSSAGLLLEQGLFLLSGTWVWLAAFGGDRRRGADRTGAGVLALLLTSMHMTLLGALLALAPRPLFAHPTVGGMSALDDQHLGGAIMLLLGGVSYLAGGLVLSGRLLRQPARGGSPGDPPVRRPPVRRLAEPHVKQVGRA